MTTSFKLILGPMMVGCLSLWGTGSVRFLEQVLRLPVKAAPAQVSPTPSADVTPSPRPTRSPTPTWAVVSQAFLPSARRAWPPYPDKPAITNADSDPKDNLFMTEWTAVARADSYLVEISRHRDFRQATRLVVQGAKFTDFDKRTWSPGTYYLRVAGRNSLGLGAWSEPRETRISALYKGWRASWNGRETLRLDGETYVTTSFLNRYQPPQEWRNSPDEITLMHFEDYPENPLHYKSLGASFVFNPWEYVPVASEMQPLPSSGNWRWNRPWILPYRLKLANGKPYSDFGIRMKAEGPAAVQPRSRGLQLSPIWQLTNTDLVEAYRSDKGLSLFAAPGDIALWYSGDDSPLLVHSIERYRLIEDGADRGNSLEFLNDLVLSSEHGSVESVQRSAPAAANRAASDPEPVIVRGRAVDRAAQLAR